MDSTVVFSKSLWNLSKTFQDGAFYEYLVLSVTSLTFIKRSLWQSSYMFLIRQESDDRVSPKSSLPSKDL